MNELFHLQLSMTDSFMDKLHSKPESTSKSVGVFLQKIIHIPVFIIVFNLTFIQDSISQGDFHRSL